MARNLFGFAKRLHDERIEREANARHETAERMDQLFGEGWLDEPVRTEPYPHVPGHDLKIESFIADDGHVAYRCLVFVGDRCTFLSQSHSSPSTARHEGVTHLNGVAYLAHLQAGGAK